MARNVNSNPEMIPFTKAHANGNDFLILDEADARGNGQSQHAQLARTLCARNTGIGAAEIRFPPSNAPA